MLWRDFYLEEIEKVKETDSEFYKTQQYGEFIIEEDYAKGIEKLTPNLIATFDYLLDKHPDEKHNNFNVEFIVKRHPSENYQSVAFKITHKESKKVSDRIHDKLKEKYNQLKESV
jgi:hypothetical protein